jgi:hypothetical protein
MRSDEHKSNERHDQSSPPPIPGPVLALIFALLAAALVLGYLLVNKLADMSRDEDCALAHRRNCAAIMAPSSSMRA